MNFAELNQRPVIVAVAGPNGAGKSTFYEAHLRAVGLRFLNADVLVGELGLDAYAAAKIAARLRRELVSQRESFVFETVFSDPANDKLNFLKDAVKAGYTVVLCFIGISGAARSEERVAMRVSQGGHDVPSEKLLARYPRTLSNLQKAIKELPCVLVFDNDDIRTPYRKVAAFQHGKRVGFGGKDPQWFRNVIQD